MQQTDSDGSSATSRLDETKAKAEQVLRRLLPADLSVKSYCWQGKVYKNIQYTKQRSFEENLALLSPEEVALLTEFSKTANHYSIIWRLADPEDRWSSLSKRKGCTEQDNERLVIEEKRNQLDGFLGKLRDRDREQQQEREREERKIRRAKEAEIAAAAEAAAPKRPDNLIESIFKRKNKPKPINPAPVELTIKEMRPHLETFFRELAEHLGCRCKLSESKRYLDVKFGNDTVKFSLDPELNGGFFLPKSKTPFPGSDVIKSYIWMFAPDKITEKDDGTMTTDQYTLLNAVRDIRLWLKELPNYQRPVQPDETLENAAEIMEIMLPNLKLTAKMSPTQVRKAVVDWVTSETDYTLQDFETDAPQFLDNGEFRALIEYWSKRDDLPFTCRLNKRAGNNYRLNIKRKLDNTIPLTKDLTEHSD